MTPDERPLGDPTLATLVQEAYLEGWASRASCPTLPDAEGWLLSASHVRTDFIPDLSFEALTLLEAAYTEGRTDRARKGGAIEPDWQASDASRTAGEIRGAQAQDMAREAQGFSTAMREVTDDITWQQRHARLGTSLAAADIVARIQARTQSEEVKEAPPEPALSATPSESEKPAQAPARDGLEAGPFDSYFRIIGQKNGKVEIEINLPAAVSAMADQMAAANDQTTQDFLTEAMEEYLTRRALADASPSTSTKRRFFRRRTS